MGATVNYASKAVSSAATLTTGDTSRTAPANVGTVFDPSAFSASGGMCERIVAMPLATIAADTVLRIFKHDGSAYHLYAEVAIRAQTVTGSGQVQGYVLSAVNNPELFPIMVPPNWTLRASINDTVTGIQVQAEGGGF